MLTTIINNTYMITKKAENQEKQRIKSGVILIILFLTV